MEVNSLVTNHGATTFYNELVSSFVNCISFKVNVAFVTYSGLQLLLDILKESENKSVKGYVITSTYLNFTDPKSIRKLTTFKNIEVRVFVASQNQGFHPKSYIFEYEDHFKVFVGSSNLTQTALKTNIEWNVKIISKKCDFINAVNFEFNRLWSQSQLANGQLLDQYENFINSLKAKRHHKVFQTQTDIQPNSMQQEALVNLDRLRRFGERKALVIAATGSGKTYMAAFDVKVVKPKRLLFLCHRESILIDAMHSFIKLLDIDLNYCGLMTGSRKEIEKPYLFATNLSIINSLDSFSKEHFDYIVIDEAHHVAANTFSSILEHFHPKFLLGMTATPERGDASSIYEKFDNNIATEIRLRDALEKNLVVPFHYFGITEASGIDYENIDISNIEQVAQLLKTHFRVEYILSNIEFYGYEGDKLKAIGFCANVDHAKFMAKSFCEAGIQSIALTSNNSEDDRQNAIFDLGEEDSDLQVIFTVDIFNEGIDIPSLNLVLMLRPTSSPIIFLQQLGRGLRKHPDKSFLTVLDFIGNHNRSFLIAIALYGNQYFDKDSLKVAVKNNFNNIPGCTHIRLDEISKEQILLQLENENFNSLRYLKEEYLAFKLACGNRVPRLQDYLMVDGAPDPLKFIRYSKTYLAFLGRIEKENQKYVMLNSNILLGKLYRFVCDHLPLKRVPEILILKMLLSQNSVSQIQVEYELSKNGYSYSPSSIQYAFRYLEGEFFDSSDSKKYPPIGHMMAAEEIINTNAEQMKLRELFSSDLNLSVINFTSSPEIRQIANDKSAKSIVKDAIIYALDRHHLEFQTEINQTKFLKLYQQYNMRDVAFTSQYAKKHSAFRGQGVLKNNKDIFLFIELHKDENAIAYKDKFISQTIFQWDSPNSSKPDAGLGLDIINHIKRKLKLHLFVRKFRSIDGVVQPYIYIGEGEYVSHQYTKPITFQLSLLDKVPWQIYSELRQDK